jgi:hypothetical protein
MSAPRRLRDLVDCALTALDVPAQRELTERCSGLLCAVRVDGDAFFVRVDDAGPQTTLLSDQEPTVHLKASLVALREVVSGRDIVSALRDPLALSLSGRVADLVRLERFVQIVSAAVARSSARSSLHAAFFDLESTSGVIHLDSLSGARSLA